MIFKISSLLTLAFAASSPLTDTVTAHLVPRSEDGGQLIRRDDEIVFIDIQTSPEGQV
jgi:hypothetical protein